jgi:choline kinase
MTTYKVFIPSAGLGSRLGNETHHLNKALVSIAGKPCLAHIIEKFPEQVEIVIGVGYKSDLLRQFIHHVYPQRRIKCINVEPFEGPGSGLGQTLLQCRSELNCPFIFCANDTIVSGPIPPPNNNWIGYAKINNTDQYRGVILGDGTKVLEICSKGASAGAYPYIGLSGINDHKAFWEAMEDGKSLGAIEIGESYGLKQMLDLGVVGHEFNWFDTGSPAALETTRKALQTESEHNILDKDGESIWFIGPKVIKYSSDKSFIKNRSARAETLSGYTPRIIDTTANMYSYEMIPGSVFSKHANRPRFEYLLGWLEGFWKPIELQGSDKDKFQKTCLDFYKEKTEIRVNQYLKRFEERDSENIINGIPTPSLKSILSKINWQTLSEGLPVRFHGDLHFENILVRNDGDPSFALIDWRQDFGGLLECGDIYYDYAKLLHGLIISHEMVTLERFEIRQKLNEISYDFWRKQNLVECQMVLEESVSKKGMSWLKVEIITALIFVNIAPLHHYPYSKLLFYLGKSMLHICSEKAKDNKK